MSENKDAVQISRETYNTLKTAMQENVALAGQLAAAKKALAAMEASRNEYRSNFNEVIECVFAFTRVFGLNTPDGKRIRPTILNKSEKPISAVMGAVTDLMKDATLAEYSQKHQERLTDKFSFFTRLIPVAEFYERNNNTGN